MREIGKWRFASNNKGIVDGFNDPGIETFSADSISSMVREVIQNSVDQQVDENRPVVVDFDFFKSRRMRFLAAGSWGISLIAASKPRKEIGWQQTSLSRRRSS